MGHGYGWPWPNELHVAVNCVTRRNYCSAAFHVIGHLRPDRQRHCLIPLTTAAAAAASAMLKTMIVPHRTTTLSILMQPSRLATWTTGVVINGLTATRRARSSTDIARTQTMARRINSRSSQVQAAAQSLPRLRHVITALLRLLASLRPRRDLHHI